MFASMSLKKKLKSLISEIRVLISIGVFLCIDLRVRPKAVVSHAH